jgi:hypothetical protein
MLLPATRNIKKNACAQPEFFVGAGMEEGPEAI